jgi:hypothetical protein
MVKEHEKKSTWICDFCNSEFDDAEKTRIHELNCRNKINPVFIKGGKLKTDFGIGQGFRFGFGFGAGLFIWGLILFILGMLFFKEIVGVILATFLKSLSGKSLFSLFSLAII